jgi:Peptidase_C39 like family
VKKNLILFCIVIQWHISIGQSHKYLTINRIGQQTSNWCWAASMEMVMKYHQPTTYVSQAALSVWYDSVRIRVHGILTIPLGMSDTLRYDWLKTCDCPSLIGNASTPSSRERRFRTTIPLDYNKHPSAFESLFISRGYDAEQIITPTNTWDIIKNQIDDCKPVVVIEGIHGRSASAGHVVLAYGYKSLSNSKTSQEANIIAIHDPYPCPTGITYMISDKYLKVDSTTHKPVAVSGGAVRKGVLSIVKNISLKSGVTSCDSGEDTLLDELSSYFAQPDTVDAQKVRLRYISPEKLITTNFIKKMKSNWNSLEEQILSNNFSTIRYKNNIVYQYDFFDKGLALSKVSKDLQLNLEPVFTLKDKKIKLSNNGNGIPYSLVEEVISGEKYYRFYYGFRIYLIPICYVDKYNDLKINNTFLERNVLKAIQVMTLKSNYVKFLPNLNNYSNEQKRN